MRVLTAIALLICAGIPVVVHAAGRFPQHRVGYNRSVSRLLHATARRPQHPIAYHRTVDASLIMLSRLAPADAYFGRQRESILEIRNRLDTIGRMSDDEMRGRTAELNDLRDAIQDWRLRYPQDPWLPRATERLNRDYERVGRYSDRLLRLAH